MEINPTVSLLTPDEQKILDVAKPKDGQTLHDYVQSHGIEHFSAAETLRLRRLGRSAPLPPRSLWPNIIPTLRIADQIRRELGAPLLVGNGYRPKDLNKLVGGAAGSKHIYYRALDLDLRSKDARLRHDLHELAAELWCAYPGLHMGLGLYGIASLRVHIDVGTGGSLSGRRWRPAHWGAYTASVVADVRDGLMR